MLKPKISRAGAVFINRVLDQWLPPIVRDSRLLTLPLLRLAVGRQAPLYATFKQRVAWLTEREFAEVYEQAASGLVHGDCDLNSACIDRILTSIVGETVLDAGCGRGALLKLLKHRFCASGCDVVVEPSVAEALPDVKIVAARIEALPYAEGEFDTVICTHTLEHVRDLSRAVDELRRVAKQRLIIVVPRQRCYRHAFNLHLHFFPYPESVFIASRAPQGARCELVDGDFFYIEDRPSAPEH